MEACYYGWIAARDLQQREHSRTRNSADAAKGVSLLGLDIGSSGCKAIVFDESRGDHRGGEGALRDAVSVGSGLRVSDGTVARAVPSASPPATRAALLRI